MLHKKESTLDPSNYRPISLLNQFGKIFESLIADIIRFWAEDNDKIDIIQAGFRKKRSTNDQLYTLSQYCYEGFNRGKQTDTIFIDFEKAYDKVWHKGLLYKLKALRMPDEDLFMIKSFLEDRKCFIQNGKEKSEKFTPENGVPQGSCLSPLLFILFVVDIPTHEKVKQSKFADDLALMAQISKGKRRRNINPANKDLQTLLNNINKWCLKWRMKINIKKTILLSITKGIPIDTTYTIDNQPISRKIEAKFLGITLDSKLNLNSHISKKIGQAHSKLEYLIKMNNLNFSMRAKRKAYIQLIRPILEYGSAILCTLTKANESKLEIFQNKCLRLITNSARYTNIKTLQDESNIKPITTRIKDLAKVWFTQAKANPKNSVSHIREVFFNGFDTISTPHVVISNHT